MDINDFHFAEGETLLFDKPLGWTSFDVVNKIRWTIKNYLKHTVVQNNPEPGEKSKFSLKVGHAGTLDPLATGLLIVCTGKMTKRISEIQDAEKEYTGTIQLGGITPSFDCETPVSERFETKQITNKMISDAAQIFTGKQMQMPPAFSALKIKGKPAYEIARQGNVPVLERREITISEFEITRIDLEKTQTIDFRVVCSKGTYIRSLAYDFGRQLKSGAYLSALCRTRIGEFRLENALKVSGFVEFFQKTEE